MIVTITGGTPNIKLSGVQQRTNTLLCHVISAVIFMSITWKLRAMKF